MTKFLCQLQSNRKERVRYPHFVHFILEINDEFEIAVLFVEILHVKIRELREEELIVSEDEISFSLKEIELEEWKIEGIKDYVFFSLSL